MFKHILVATDGSELSLQAVRAAARLARELGAKLSGVFVMMEFTGAAFPEYAAFSTMTYENFVRESEEEAKKVLAAFEREAKEAGVAYRMVTKRRAHAYEGIIEAANETASDLIVVASHGRRGVSALVLGSETNKLLTHCKIPVLVYR